MNYNRRIFRLAATAAAALFAAAVASAQAHEHGQMQGQTQGKEQVIKARVGTLLRSCSNARASNRMSRFISWASSDGLSGLALAVMGNRYALG